MASRILSGFGPAPGAGSFYYLDPWLFLLGLHGYIVQLTIGASSRVDPAPDTDPGSTGSITPLQQKWLFFDEETGDVARPGLGVRALQEEAQAPRLEAQGELVTSLMTQGGANYEKKVHNGRLSLFGS